MISVVIPLYNKETFISETLESVLQQTHTDFELLVVDDGSTDNSIQKVTAFNDPRIKLIKQANAGVSVARNLGIQEASNAWVSFLDGDDWWGPTFLEEMVNAIKTHPQNVLFASGRCRVFASEEERYSHPMLPEDGATASINYFRVISKYLPLINASNAVIKKSHFESNGYFKPGQKQHEDHDLWIRLAIKQEVVFVNKNLSYYRKVASNSASQNVYGAADFQTYLKTIIDVKAKLSEGEKGHLSKYANRFALLTYLKHYGQYSKQDKKELKPLLAQVLIGKYKSVYQLSNLLPFNLYPILKRMKS